MRLFNDTVSRRFALLAVLGLLLLPALAAARKERLELRLVRLELPGAPAAIVSADVDGDGRRDLAIAVVYTAWDQIKFEERSEMDDVVGLVEILTIVPALIDRRELRLLRGRADGGYEPMAPLAIDASVLSLSAGPPAAPVVALTDDGLAALRVRDGALVLEPLLAEPPVLARSRTFVPDLGIVHDVDADGHADVVVPTLDGAAVYLSGPDALATEPASRLVYPRDPPEGDNGKYPRSLLARRLHYSLPEVRDVTGDGLPDLLLPHHRDLWEHFHLFINAGGGRFSAPLAPLGEPARDGVPRGDDEHTDDEDDDDKLRVVHFGDLDGDGVAEYVTEEILTADDLGWRKQLKEAKRPPFRLRFHRQRPDLGMAEAAHRELDVRGYGFVDDDEGIIPGGFQDLDGDGRQDLITLTLDFTLFQVVRILATRRLDIGLDFHIWCQDATGAFRAVEGLDLSGRFRLRLNDLRIGQLSQFAGDFDGDGRADFVQLGRGKTVTIHRGREGCAYAPEPDLVLELEEAPRDLALTRVEDLDGDGLTDLLILHPRKVDEPGVTAPVGLDLYLSGGTP